MDPKATTVQAFYSALNDLELRAKRALSVANANKESLQAAFTEARNDPSPSNAQARVALLQPLIHENTKTRLQFRDLSAKFSSAINAVRGFLARAGLAPPAGLGVLPPLLVIVPVVAVTAYLVSLNILKSIEASNRAQSVAIAEAVRVSQDPAASPDEKRQALDAIMKQAKAPASSDPLGVGAFVPLLALVAAIVIVPPVLRTIKR